MHRIRKGHAMSDWIIWAGEVVLFLAISIWGLYRAIYGRRRRHSSPRWHRVEPPPLNLADRPKDERTW